LSLQPQPVTAILVAGTGSVSRRCARILGKADLPVGQVRDWQQLLEHLDNGGLSLLIIEPGLKGMNLLEGLRLVRKIYPHLLSLVLGPIPPELQGPTLQAGAEDIMPGDLPPPLLLNWVQSFGERQRLHQDNEGLRSQILETEAYLAQILDQLEEGILTTDLTGRVLSANRMAQNLFQVPAGTLKGRALEDISFVGDGLHNLAQGVLRVMETGGHEGRFLLTPGVGSPLPVYFRGTVYRQEGQVMGAILVFRDLTGQEALELRLEESERLAALGQIAAGVAHEIRNPLMAMGGLLKRWERKLPEDHPGQGYLPAILENVRRLETMVQEIDEYLRHVRTSGEQRAEVGLEAVLKTALGKLEAHLNPDLVHLEIGPMPRIKLLGDAGSLVEMFFQMLLNGVEAMPQGGTLKLEAGEENRQAVIRIADTGRGIAPEDLASIYHPFFTTKMTGAGMGLTKVYMIAQRHRGLIEVDSRPNQGTTFTVRLPSKANAPG